MGHRHRRRRHVRRAPQPARRRRRRGSRRPTARAAAAIAAKTSTACAAIMIATGWPSPRRGGGRSGSTRSASAHRILRVDAAARTLSRGRDLGAVQLSGGQPAVLDDERPQRTHVSRSVAERSAATPAGSSAVRPSTGSRRWSTRIPTPSSSSVHHYVLKDTTVASGEWEGVCRSATGELVEHYHRPFEQGTPNGASYLYWVDSKPDSAAFEILPGRPSGPGCVVARRPHPHPSRRLVRRQNAHRTTLGHLVSQCRIAEPPPHARSPRYRSAVC